MLRDMWRNRPLLLALARRQYELRYRQSLVGLFWALLPPLATLAAATLVFHGVMRVNTGKVSYPLFALAGLVPWTFFASSLTFGVSSVIVASSLVTRLPFPRATLPLSMVATALLDLLIAGGIFIIFTYLTGNALPLTALMFPLLLLIEIAFTVGTVAFLCALNVFARDIKLAVPIGVQLWLFLTPVMYPLDAVPSELRSLYMLNPLTGLLEGFRAILVYGRMPDPSLLVPALAGALLALAVGGWYFKATESRFPDVI